MSFWVPEIPTPEIVNAKDAQGLWASHSGVVLPFIPIRPQNSLHKSFKRACKFFMYPELDAREKC